MRQADAQTRKAKAGRMKLTLPFTPVRFYGEGNKLLAEFTEGSLRMPEFPFPWMIVPTHFLPEAHRALTMIVSNDPSPDAPMDVQVTEEGVTFENPALDDTQQLKLHLDGSWTNYGDKVGRSGAVALALTEWAESLGFRRWSKDDEQSHEP